MPELADGDALTDTRPAVLVIGAGMYVCGRGTPTYGTVLPTLIQAQTQGLIGEIRVAATSRNSIDALQARLVEINARMGTTTSVRDYPTRDGHDPLVYRQALAEMPQPACAIVVVPDHLHHEITADVIRAGIHPLVVKPFTPTVREGLDLIRLAEQHNVYGAVEFHKRFDESNLLLRQTLTDNRLGDVSYITVEYSQRRAMREIFQAWLADTNIFQYLGVHYVDLVYFFTGARPLRALATGQPARPESGAAPGADSIQGMIEWEDQPTGQRFVSTIVTNWIDPNSTSAVSDQKITVVGTRGRYQADQKNRGVQLVTEDHQGVEELNPYFCQFYRGGDGNFGVHGYGPRCITQFLKDVRDVIDGKLRREDLIEERPSFQQSLVSTAVVEAINRSLANEGEWVPVEDTSAMLQNTAQQAVY